MGSMTLESGFTADPAAGTPTFRHTEFGVVMAGTVLGAFNGSGQTIAMLPTGGEAVGSYRPRQLRRCPVAARSGANPAAGYVEVGPTGAVVVVATADWVCLDGVVLPMRG